LDKTFLELALRAGASAVPMAKARSTLTRIVDEAEFHGQTTVLTRNGRPAAMIIPVPGKTLAIKVSLKAMAGKS
jgi:antitoxin (DNA-binding transcriptional repressor) of toxin-antitoxin stability system